MWLPLQVLLDHRELSWQQGWTFLWMMLSGLGAPLLHHLCQRPPTLARRAGSTWAPLNRPAKRTCRSLASGQVCEFYSRFSHQQPMRVKPIYISAFRQNLCPAAKKRANCLYFCAQAPSSGRSSRWSRNRLHRWKFMLTRSWHSSRHSACPSRRPLPRPACACAWMRLTWRSTSSMTP